MNTRMLMSASAAALGAGGLGASFLPQEALVYAGAPPTPALVALVQVFGAALLGFGFVNWMAKGALIGGIYNRPVAFGNALHFAVGAITLVRLSMAEPSLPLVVVCALYATFAVAFGFLLFGSPVPAAGPRADRGGRAPGSGEGDR